MRTAIEGVSRVHRYSRFLPLLCLGLGVACPALADERLAMPFECGIEGGEVRLVPAAEMSYPIVGARDEQAVTACNPGTSSAGCRTIMVHRFAISCGGTEVTWMQVAAAVNVAGDKRTWIEDDRLNVVLPSRHPAPAPRGECVDRKFDAASGLQRRVVLKQDCLPWRRRSQIDHVVFPAGYAPIGELGARLVLDVPSDAPGIQLAKVDPGAVWEPSVVLEPSNEHVESAAAGSDWVTVVRKEAERGLRAPSLSGGMPWGWTWLLSAMAVATAAIFARMRYPQAIPVRLNLFGRSRRLSDPSQGGRVVAALLERTEGVVNGLKGATALREVLLSELDRVHRTLANVEAAGRDTSGAEREEHDARTASLHRALVRDLERIGRIADSAASSFSGAQRSSELPRTKSEAYEVLGVNADVSETVLKKIADALRMSWHPDHARDEDDRVEREQRIRQINAAWELIADRRAAV